MAAPAAVLSIFVKANTSQATTAMARMNTQLGTTEKRAGKMSGALKMAGKVGAVGLAAGLAYSVKKAADFEAQMSSLESVTNSNARQMGRFKKQALDAGAATKFSALDAAKAQTELAKGGLSVSQIMKGGLKSSLALAAAGEMDLAEAAETTANAIKLFGLEGKDTMKVADALATAANATTADVTDFAMALKQGGGVAKMAGLSFTETVLALEALAETGVRNSDAGTSMKTAFIQLLKPSKRQAELAGELGLNFVSASGGMKSMSDISGMLRSKLGGMTKAQRTAALATLAGTDGVRTLNALYAAGPDKLDKMKAGLDKSGTAAAVAAKKQDNLKGKVENLMGSIETLAIIVGSVLLPPLTDATVAVTKFLNSLSSGKGPAGEVMGTLTSLSESLGLSRKDWTQFGQAVSNAWNFASSVIRRVAPGILTMVRGWAMMVGGALKIITGILTLDFGMAWAGVKQIFSGALNTILGVLRASTGPFRELVVRLAGVVKGPFVAAWNAVKTAASVGLRALVTLVRTFTSPQRAAIGALVNAMKGPFAAAWGAMRTVARGALAAILNLLRTFTAPHRAAARVLGAAIRTPIAAGFHAARAVAGTVLRAIVAVVRAMAGPWRAAGGVLGAAIKGPVTTAMNVMKQTIGRALTASKLAFSTHAKAVLTVMGALLKGIGGAASGIHSVFSAVGRVVGRIAGFIVSAINALVRAVGTAKDAVKGAMPSMPNLPSIPGVHLQRGGKIAKGKASGDSVPAMLERGEYVLNRNAVRKVGTKQLDAVNYGDAPRFQRGGPVGMQGGGWTGVSGAGVSSGAKKVALWAMRKYGATAMSAYKDRIGGSTWHAKGQAVDLAGGDMKAMGLGIDRKFRKDLEELIHTPMGFSVSSGQKVAPYAQADHFDHVHEAVLSGTRVKGAGSIGGSQIPGMKVRGSGALANVAQGAADTMRKVANAYLERVAPGDSPADSGTSLKGLGRGGAANRALARRMAAARGWKGPQWAALDDLWGQLEGSWDENVSNYAGSGAYGIAQALPSSKYPPAGRPDAPPGLKKARAQIGWGLNYIAERYTNPVGAKAARLAKGWYQKGGIVQALAKGGGAGRGFPSAKEITGQEKRIESLKTKLGDPKKDTKGYAWAKKRQGKKQAKLQTDLKRAQSVLGSLKGRRKKGLSGRKKVGAKLSKQVEGFKLPLNTSKGITAAQAHIQDLSDAFDQDVDLFRSTTVTDAEGNEVELNQDELNNLVAQKTQIRNLVGGDPMGSGGQIAHFQKVIPMVQGRIKATTEFMAKMKKRVEKNMKKLRDYLDRAAKLRKSIATIDRTVKQIRKKKKLSDADKKKLQNLGGKREKYSDALNIITQRRIPALEADNQLLTGDKRPKQPLDVAKMSAGEGLLPDAFAILGTGDSTTGGEGGIDLRGFMAEFQDKLRPGGLQAEWHGHDITIKALLKEGAEKPKAAAQGTDTELAGLLRQQLQQANLRTAVSEAQFKVLRDAPPFGGSFAAGGIVPGPLGSPRTVIAHGGEAIGKPGNVQVIINGDIVGTPRGKDPVELVIGDRRFDAAVEQSTRKMARSGARGLPGRPGALK